MNYKNFYSEIGKLLYAMAYIDGTISKQEKNVVLQKIRKELIPMEHRLDEFGTPLPYYIEAEFEFLDEQIIDAEPAFESFMDYIDEHHTAFDQRTLKVCMHLARAVARAFHQTNKKEKALLKRLEKLIAKLSPLIPSQLVVHEEVL